MKKTWKKIMAACCAVVMLVTLPCVYVYADESKQEEVGIADTVEITEEQSTIDDFSDLNEATYVEAETPAEVTEAAETFEIAGNNETVDLEAAISDVEEVGGTGDDYPANLKNAARDSIVDPWNFYNRECTSFVAWCLNSRNGVHFTNQYLGAARWGNANTWGTVAAEKGVRVDKNPAVAAVAWCNTGKYGHVAWVNSVNGGNVFIEEYNYSSKGNYDTRTIAASNPTGYIHIADINPNPVEIEAGYYKIQYGGNRFLNVSGNLTDDGTNIDIYSSVTYPGQTFYIDWNWNHSGYYIQHLTSQKYVTTDTNSSGPHNVSLFSGNGNDGQQWIAEDAGDGYVYLRNLYGYYLDVCNGVNADQQNVQVWNYNGGEAQKWKLIRVSGEDMMSVEPGYYKLQYGDNRFLNVSGNLTEDGTNIDIYSSVTYPGQTFYIDRNWNNSGYYLQHLTSQKYVTTDTNSTGTHNVILLSGNGNDGQQWIIEDAGDGYVYLRN